MHYGFKYIITLFSLYSIISCINVKDINKTYQKGKKIDEKQYNENKDNPPLLSFRETFRNNHQSSCVKTKRSLSKEKEHDLQKIIDFFIEQTNVSNKEIILNLYYDSWEDDLYLVVITAFDRDMPIGKVEKDNIDYGRYKYKGMNIFNIYK